MKSFKVKLEFYGIAGRYKNQRIICAKNVQSAENKALDIIGNRDGQILSITEVYDTNATEGQPNEK